MKLYTFGSKENPTLLLLPGTCCHWQANFGGVIPLLEADFYVVCISYDGFDEIKPDTIFPDMLTETAKIEASIQENFGGRIHAAYGCSLGGSFVSLLVQRQKIHIDHAIIGSSDMDQGGGLSAKAQGWLMAKVLTGILHSGRLPDWMQKRLGQRPPEEWDYYSKFVELFCGNGKMRFVKKESVYNQFYSDLITPVQDAIAIPDTTIHCFYAVKMGKKYEARYRQHFKVPDIRRHELQHEELLMCYPEQWATEVRACCTMPKKGPMEHDETQQEPLRLSVAEDGFCGIWHPAERETDPAKTVIVLGGSEGNENIPMNVGRLFAAQGISALGVCYWNVPGLPNDLVRVPLESFEKAAQWLNARGYGRVYLYGISEGALAALLAASVIPSISGVVAVSPIHCVWGGMVGNGSMFSKKFTDASAFTWRGKDFPCMKAELRYWPGIKHLLLHHEIDLAYLYERPLTQFREETAIPVEQIQGDILLIYPQKDNCWPSPAAVAYMQRRLKNHGFPHEVTALCYEKASHLLVPLNPKQLKMFRVEKQFPAECKHSREDAFEQTVAWVNTRK